jgi:hypothetical protein
MVDIIDAIDGGEGVGEHRCYILYIYIYIYIGVDLMKMVTDLVVVVVYSGGGRKRTGQSWEDMQFDWSVTVSGWWRRFRGNRNTIFSQ